ncbi:MAG TPA: GGDEF domain-containing protein [Solirubrobacteraceae bacterium]|nr:GGDEF domain-containing protein [Solirubrobacteraceae bacterium]
MHDDSGRRSDCFRVWSAELETGVPGSAPDQDHEALAELRARVIRTGESGQVEYQVREGRSVRWLSTVMAVAERSGDQVTRVCGYTFDVTARKRLEGRRQADSESLGAYRGVLDRLSRGEPLQQILDAGAAWIDGQIPGLGCAILLVDRRKGLMRQAAGPALDPGFAALVEGLRVGEGFGPWGAAAARREPVIIGNLRAEPAGELHQGLARLGVRSLWTSPLYRTGGDEVIAVIALYQAVPARPRKRELELVASMGQLLALAIEHGSVAERARAETNVDPLTGTLNRVRFMELINERTAASSVPVAVICLEIDRFKPLRLTLGQHAGDQLIAEVGRRLLAAAGSDGLVGHFSADEFGLMVDAPDERAVLAVTDAIRESFRTPVVLEGTEFFLSFPLGIAYGDQTAGAYGLVRDAAAAMHAARADGIGRLRVFDRRISTQLRDHVEREAELRRALAEDEFVMHYQPLLRLGDRVWDRAETLVRWQHPTRGLIFPGEFIPLAEQTGLMGALGERVLELVIAQAKLWSRTLPGIQLSVNVSGIQLARPRFGDRVLELLDAAGLPPATLLFEVTESAILQDVGAAQATIARLRAAGIRTAIDDFGTGYSSLARLGELPITGVKIDRAFVAGLGEDEKPRAIFAAIAQIVRAHGLLIIAEGIEDQRTLAEIAACGCDFAQGYHLCRPGPPEAIEPLLAAPVPDALLAALSA